MQSRAGSCLRRVLGQIDLRKRGQVPEVSDVETMAASAPLRLSSDIWQLLEAELNQEHKAPGTRALYLGELRSFDQFMQSRCGDQWDLRALTRRDLVAYSNYLSQVRRNRASTQANKLSRLRSLFQYLVLNEILPYNPFKNLGRVRVTDRDRKERVRLTPDEAVRFLTEIASASHERLRNIAMMQVLIFGGLRVGELVALRRRDLDVAERQLHVMGKGGKYRRVGLPDNTIANLVRYCDSVPAAADAPLFLSQRRPETSPPPDPAGGDPSLATACPPGYYPLDTIAVYFLVYRHARRAGIRKRVTPHALRRTCATMLLKGDVNIKKIQRILGHSQISTTLTHYAEVEEREAAEAAREQHYLKDYAVLAEAPPSAGFAARSGGRTPRSGSAQPKTARRASRGAARGRSQ